MFWLSRVTWAKSLLTSIASLSSSMQNHVDQTLGVDDDEQDHDETPRDELEENENEFKIRIRIKLAKFRYILNIPPPSQQPL